MMLINDDHIDDNSGHEGAYFGNDDHDDDYYIVVSCQRQ